MASLEHELNDAMALDAEPIIEQIKAWRRGNCTAAGCAIATWQTVRLLFGRDATPKAVVAGSVSRDQGAPTRAAGRAGRPR